MKTKISSREHKVFEKDANGATVEKTRPDHPQARILATSNLSRKNIQGAANRDQAVQRRKEALLKTWEWPEDEVMSQLGYARTLAQELGKDTPDFDKVMGEIIQRLVFAAEEERLLFMGYSVNQINFLKASRRNWEKLKDWEYEPDKGTGDELIRAPSPRVIRNILAHFVRYPRDLEHRAWSVIHDFFNFEAEIDKEIPTYTRVPTDFEKAGFSDDLPGEAPVLDRNSFRVIKEADGIFSLEITPVENPGQQRWDKVVVPLHPRSALARNPKAIRKQLLEWVSIPENARLVYLILQDYSLGKDTLLIGEQETGKTELIKELQFLVGTSPRLKVDMTPSTKPKDLTYQTHVGEQGKPGVFGFKKKPVALAMELGVPVHLDEANHAESIAVLNDVLDSRTLVDPLGNREKPNRGVVFWLGANPPGQGFLVNSFSAEFLERLKIRKVNPVPPPQMRTLVEPFMYKEGKAVNSRFVGEEIKEGPDRGKWSGLIGLAWKIRELRAQDPAFLPRAPGPGTTAAIVAEVLEHFETRLADENIRLREELAEEGVTAPAERLAQIVKNYFLKAYDSDSVLKAALRRHMKSPQEVLREILLQKFNMQGKSGKENAAWQKNFTQALAAVGFWVDQQKAPDKDGLMEFLAGEELVAKSYPLVRAPKTGISNLDSLLTYFQIYPESGSYLAKASELEGQLRLLLEQDPEKWQAVDFSERLRRFSVLAEIDGVLKTTIEARKEIMKGGNARLQANLIKLEKVVQDMIKQITGRGWPVSFLKQAETPDFNAAEVFRVWLAAYAEKGQAIKGHPDPNVRDLLARIAVFGKDSHYNKEMNAELLRQLKAGPGARAEMRSLPEEIEKIETDLQAAKDGLGALKAMGDLVDADSIQVAKDQVAALEAQLEKIRSRTPGLDSPEHAQLLALKAQLKEVQAKIKKAKAQGSVPEGEIKITGIAADAGPLKDLPAKVGKSYIVFDAAGNESHGSIRSQSLLKIGKQTFWVSGGEAGQTAVIEFNEAGEIVENSPKALKIGEFLNPAHGNKYISHIAVYSIGDHFFLVSVGDAGNNSVIEFDKDGEIVKYNAKALEIHRLLNLAHGDSSIHHTAVYSIGGHSFLVSVGSEDKAGVIEFDEAGGIVENSAKAQKIKEFLQAKRNRASMQRTALHSIGGHSFLVSIGAEGKMDVIELNEAGEIIENSPKAETIQKILKSAHGAQTISHTAVYFIGGHFFLVSVGSSGSVGVIEFDESGEIVTDSVKAGNIKALFKQNHRDLWIGHTAVYTIGDHSFLVSVGYSGRPGVIEFDAAGEIVKDESSVTQTIKKFLKQAHGIEGIFETALYSISGKPYLMSIGDKGLLGIIGLTGEAVVSSPAPDLAPLESREKELSKQIASLEKLIALRAEHQEVKAKIEKAKAQGEIRLTGFAPDAGALKGLPAKVKESYREVNAQGDEISYNSIRSQSLLKIGNQTFWVSGGDKGSAAVFEFNEAGEIIENSRKAQDIQELLKAVHGNSAIYHTAVYSIQGHFFLLSTGNKGKPGVIEFDEAGGIVENSVKAQTIKGLLQAKHDGFSIKHTALYSIGGHSFLLSAGESGKAGVIEFNETGEIVKDSTKAGEILEHLKSAHNNLEIFNTTFYFIGEHSFLVSAGMAGRIDVIEFNRKGEIVKNSAKAQKIHALLKTAHGNLTIYHTEVYSIGGHFFLVSVGYNGNKTGVIEFNKEGEIVENSPKAQEIQKLLEEAHGDLWIKHTRVYSIGGHSFLVSVGQGISGTAGVIEFNKEGEIVKEKSPVAQTIHDLLKQAHRSSTVFNTAAYSIGGKPYLMSIGAEGTLGVIGLTGEAVALDLAPLESREKELSKQIASLEKLIALRAEHEEVRDKIKKAKAQGPLLSEGEIKITGFAADAGPLKDLPAKVLESYREVDQQGKVSLGESILSQSLLKIGKQTFWVSGGDGGKMAIVEFNEAGEIVKNSPKAKKIQGFLESAHGNRRIFHIAAYSIGDHFFLISVGWNGTTGVIAFDKVGEIIENSAKALEIHRLISLVHGDKWIYHTTLYSIGGHSFLVSAGDAKAGVIEFDETGEIVQESAKVREIQRLIKFAHDTSNIEHIAFYSIAGRSFLVSVGFRGKVGVIEFDKVGEIVADSVKALEIQGILKTIHAGAWINHTAFYSIGGHSFLVSVGTEGKNGPAVIEFDEAGEIVQESAKAEKIQDLLKITHRDSEILHTAVYSIGGHSFLVSVGYYGKDGVIEFNDAGEIILGESPTAQAIKNFLKQAHGDLTIHNTAVYSIGEKPYFMSIGGQGTLGILGLTGEAVVSSPTSGLPLESQEKELSKQIASLEKLIALRAEHEEVREKIEKTKAQSAAAKLAEKVKVPPAPEFKPPAGDMVFGQIKKISVADGKDWVGYKTLGGNLKLWQWNGKDWQLEEFSDVDQWKWAEAGGNFVVETIFDDGRIELHGYNGQKWESTPVFGGGRRINFYPSEGNMVFGFSDGLSRQLHGYNGQGWRSTNIFLNVIHWHWQASNGKIAVKLDFRSSPSQTLIFNNPESKTGVERELSKQLETLEIQDAALMKQIELLENPAGLRSEARTQPTGLTEMEQIQQQLQDARAGLVSFKEMGSDIGPDIIQLAEQNVAELEARLEEIRRQTPVPGDPEHAKLLALQAELKEVQEKIGKVKAQGPVTGGEIKITGLGADAGLLKNMPAKVKQSYYDQINIRSGRVEYNAIRSQSLFKIGNQTFWMSGGDKGSAAVFEFNEIGIIIENSPKGQEIKRLLKAVHANESISRIGVYPLGEHFLLVSVGHGGKAGVIEFDKAGEIIKDSVKALEIQSLLETAHDRSSISDIALYAVGNHSVLVSVGAGGKIGTVELDEAGEIVKDGAKAKSIREFLISAHGGSSWINHTALYSVGGKSFIGSVGDDGTLGMIKLTKEGGITNGHPQEPRRRLKLAHGAFGISHTAVYSIGSHSFLLSSGANGKAGVTEFDETGLIVEDSAKARRIQNLLKSAHGHSGISKTAVYSIGSHSFLVSIGAEGKAGVIEFNEAGEIVEQESSTAQAIKNFLKIAHGDSTIYNTVVYSIAGKPYFMSIGDDGTFGIISLTGEAAVSVPNPALAPLESQEKELSRQIASLEKLMALRAEYKEVKKKIEKAKSQGPALKGEIKITGLAPDAGALKDFPAKVREVYREVDDRRGTESLGAIRTQSMIKLGNQTFWVIGGDQGQSVVVELNEAGGIVENSPKALEIQGLLKTAHDHSGIYHINVYSIGGHSFLVSVGENGKAGVIEFNEAGELVKESAKAREIQSILKKAHGNFRIMHTAFYSIGNHSFFVSVGYGGNTAVIEFDAAGEIVQEDAKAIKILELLKVPHGVSVIFRTALYSIGEHSFLVAAGMQGKTSVIEFTREGEIVKGSAKGQEIVGLLATAHGNSAIYHTAVYSIGEHSFLVSVGYDGKAGVIEFNQKGEIVENSAKAEEIRDLLVRTNGTLPINSTLMVYAVNGHSFLIHVGSEGITGVSAGVIELDEAGEVVKEESPIARAIKKSLKSAHGSEAIHNAAIYAIGGKPYLTSFGNKGTLGILGLTGEVVAPVPNPDLAALDSRENELSKQIASLEKLIALQAEHREVKKQIEKIKAQAAAVPEGESRINDIAPDTGILKDLPAKVRESYVEADENDGSKSYKTIESQSLLKIGSQTFWVSGGMYGKTAVFEFNEAGKIIENSPKAREIQELLKAGHGNFTINHIAVYSIGDHSFLVSVGSTGTARVIEFDPAGEIVKGSPRAQKIQDLIKSTHGDLRINHTAFYSIGEHFFLVSAGDGGSAGVIEFNKEGEIVKDSVKGKAIREVLKMDHGNLRISHTAFYSIGDHSFLVSVGAASKAGVIEFNKEGKMIQDSKARGQKIGELLTAAHDGNWTISHTALYSIGGHFFLVSVGFGPMAGVIEFDETGEIIENSPKAQLIKGRLIANSDSFINHTAVYSVGGHSFLVSVGYRGSARVIEFDEAGEIVKDSAKAEAVRILLKLAHSGNTINETAAYSIGGRPYLMSIGDQGTLGIIGLLTELSFLESREKELSRKIEALENPEAVQAGPVRRSESRTQPKGLTKIQEIEQQLEAAKAGLESLKAMGDLVTTENIQHAEEQVEKLQARLEAIRGQSPAPGSPEQARLLALKAELQAVRDKIEKAKRQAQAPVSEGEMKITGIAVDAGPLKDLPSKVKDAYFNSAGMTRIGNFTDIRSQSLLKIGNQTFWVSAGEKGKTTVFEFNEAGKIIENSPKAQEIQSLLIAAHADSPVYHTAVYSIGGSSFLVSAGKKTGVIEFDKAGNIVKFSSKAQDIQEHLQFFHGDWPILHTTFYTIRDHSFLMSMGEGGRVKLIEFNQEGEIVKRPKRTMKIREYLELIYLNTGISHASVYSIGGHSFLVSGGYEGKTAVIELSAAGGIVKNSSKAKKIQKRLKITHGNASISQTAVYSIGGHSFLVSVGGEGNAGVIEFNEAGEIDTSPKAQEMRRLLETAHNGLTISHTAVYSIAGHSFLVSVGANGYAGVIEFDEAGKIVQAVSPAAQTIKKLLQQAHGIFLIHSTAVYFIGGKPYLMSIGTIGTLGIIGLTAEAAAPTQAPDLAPLESREKELSKQIASLEKLIALQAEHKEVKDKIEKAKAQGPVVEGEIRITGFASDAGVLKGFPAKVKPFYFNSGTRNYEEIHAQSLLKIGNQTFWVSGGGKGKTTVFELNETGGIVDDSPKALGIQSLLTATHGDLAIYHIAVYSIGRHSFLVSVGDGGKAEIIEFDEAGNIVKPSSKAQVIRERLLRHGDGAIYFTTFYTIGDHSFFVSVGEHGRVQVIEFDQAGEVVDVNKNIRERFETIYGDMGIHHASVYSIGGRFFLVSGSYEGKAGVMALNAAGEVIKFSPKAQEIREHLQSNHGNSGIYQTAFYSIGGHFLLVSVGGEGKAGVIEFNEAGEIVKDSAKAKEIKSFLETSRASSITHTAVYSIGGHSFLIGVGRTGKVVVVTEFDKAGETSREETPTEQKIRKSLNQAHGRSTIYGTAVYLIGGRPYLMSIGVKGTLGIIGLTGEAVVSVPNPALAPLEAQEKELSKQIESLEKLIALQAELKEVKDKIEKAKAQGPAAEGEMKITGISEAVRPLRGLAAKVRKMYGKRDKKGKVEFQDIGSQSLLKIGHQTFWISGGQAGKKAVIEFDAAGKMIENSSTALKIQKLLKLTHGNSDINHIAAYSIGGRLFLVSVGEKGKAGMIEFDKDGKIIELSSMGQKIQERLLANHRNSTIMHTASYSIGGCFFLVSAGAGGRAGVIEFDEAGEIINHIEADVLLQTAHGNSKIDHTGVYSIGGHFFLVSVGEFGKAGVIEFDKNGNIVRVSPKAKRIQALLQASHGEWTIFQTAFYSIGDHFFLVSTGWEGTAGVIEFNKAGEIVENSTKAAEIGKILHDQHGQGGIFHTAMYSIKGRSFLVSVGTEGKAIAIEFGPTGEITKTEGSRAKAIRDHLRASHDFDSIYETAIYPIGGKPYLMSIGAQGKLGILGLTGQAAAPGQTIPDLALLEAREKELSKQIEALEKPSAVQAQTPKSRPRVKRSEVRSLISPPVIAAALTLLGIFSVPDAFALGENGVTAILKENKPELFAGHPEAHYFSILRNRHPAAVLERPLPVVRIYRDIPDLSAPEVQLLLDSVASNPSWKLHFSFPGLPRASVKDFERKFTAEVLHRRGSAEGSRKVQVTSETGLAQAIALIKHAQGGRLLVYSDSLKDAETLRHQMAGKEMQGLFVYNNLLVSGEPLKKAADLLKEAGALLAAFDFVLSPEALPSTVQNAAEILGHHISLMAEVRRLVEQAA